LKADRQHSKRAATEGACGLEPDTGLLPAFLGEEGDLFAFEVKFVVDDALGREIAAWAQGALRAGRAGEPAPSGAYRVHTLYLDTPGLDSFRRRPGFKKRRLRVRRYGSADVLHLEEKTKKGERVATRHAPISARALDQLGGAEPVSDPDVAWFQRRIARRRLVPTARVSCVRTAFLAADEHEAARLTLDAEVRTAAERSWCVAPVAGGVELLDGRQVLELKYRHAMPAAFKDLVVRYALVPRAASKYRLAVAALGLEPRRIDHA
jgi:hypothetical protein